MKAVQVLIVIAIFLSLALPALANQRSNLPAVQSQIHKPGFVPPKPNATAHHHPNITRAGATTANTMARSIRTNKASLRNRA